DFLRTDRLADTPFFFVANFFDPHHGFGAPQEYLDHYPLDEIPPPVTTPAELDAKPPIQAEASKRSYAGAARGYAEYSATELAEARRAYFAMVSLVDDEVGRILAALEETGLDQNTIVVFTSDHGEMLGDHQLMLKGPFMYDCAVKVPLIVRWPGVSQPASRRPELVQWVDLAPTFLEAAGLPIPDPIQGTSLVPLISGTDVSWRDWALCQYRNSGNPYSEPVHVTMLRHGRYKLVVHHGAPASARGRAPAHGRPRGGAASSPGAAPRPRPVGAPPRGAGAGGGARRGVLRPRGRPGGATVPVGPTGLSRLPIGGLHV